jgi:hypothetical protein
MYKSRDQFKPNQTIILPEYCSPSSPCPMLPACPNINGQSPTFHRCLDRLEGKDKVQKDLRYSVSEYAKRKYKGGVNV